MADLSRKTASIYINHAPAEEALKKLQGDADKLTQKIRDGEAAGKSMVNEIKKLSTAKEAIAGVQKQIDSGLRPSFNQLQTLVAKTRAELKRMSEDDPGFVQRAKDLNRYSTEMNRLGSQIGAVKEAGGGIKGALMDLLPVAGFAAAGAAVGAFLKDAVVEAMEAEKATARFKATLDNVGKSDSFERLQGKANAMAERFKFLDNDDIVGVFEKLVTFGKLTEAQIDQLTPVIVNFAAKSKISVDESASVIIKALEGNGKALKEYGINIKDAKTDSERFAVVMGDLGDKVNGAADAFGSTTQGKIAETEQTIKNLKEEIGTGLLPFIQKFFEGVNALIGGIDAAFENAKDNWKKLKQFVTGEDTTAKELAEKQGNDMSAFAESIASEFGQKTIAQQQKLADSYKSIFIASQQALSEFLKSAGSDNLEERNKLMARQDQDEKIFLASQRTLEEAVAQKKKNDADEAAKEAEANAKKAEEANKRAQEKAAADLASSLQRADAYNRKALEAHRKADIADLQLSKDKYKSEIDDQDKSLADRFNAIVLFHDAGKELIKKTMDDRQNELDLEIATDKKAAKSKEEFAAIEKNRVEKQAEIIKQNALSTSNFEIEVAKAYTTASEQEYKKVTAAAEKSFQERKKNDEQKFKDKVNLVGIDTDSKLLAIDKAFQDGKIKNVVEYQKQREKILTEGKQKELQTELATLEALQKYYQLFGIASTDLDKQIADKKVDISTTTTATTTKDDKAALDKKLEFANFVISSAQQVAGVLSTINEAKNAEDEAAIAKNNARQAEEQNKLQRQLNSKVLTQKEYDRQVKALEEKTRKENAALKKKEFERNKRAQIIQAVMSGAAAIVSTLAAVPGFTDIISLGLFRAINIGLAIATTAAQIATISAQKAPEFAKGGMLKGPTHSQGGMPVINPATGKKVAEVEGGEVIVSRNTYRNNKGIIDELLYSSMYGNGAPITPAWQNRRYQPVNYSGITKTIERVRLYENGGVFTSPGQTGNAPAAQDAGAQLPYAELIEMINALRADINTPKKNYVLVSDVNAANDTLDLIKKETTIKRT